MKPTATILGLSGVLAAGLLVSATGSMRAQSTPKVYFACYVPTSGTVYRIKEPGLKTQCQSNQVEFSWTDGKDAVRTGDAAGGDLLGSYPNPSVAALRGQPVSNAAPTTTGQVLAWNGSAWAPATSPTGPQGPPGPAGPPGVSGWELVVGPEVTLGQFENKQSNVACPAGKKPVGGGYSKFGTILGGFLVLQNGPFEVINDSGWSVWILNNDLLSTMSFITYVICVSI